jgi:signal transduction histidine kinase
MLGLGGGSPESNAAIAVARVWRQARLASVLALVAIGFGLTTLFMAALRVDGQPSQAWPAVSEVVFVLALFGVAVLGVLVVAARPRNAVGWLMVICAVIGAADLAAFATVLAAYARGWNGYGIRLIALFDSFAFFLGAPLLAVYVLLLFPNGRSAGRGWRLFALVYGIAFVFVDVVGSLDPGGVDGFPNPLAVHGWLGTAIHDFDAHSGWILPFGTVAATLSVVLYLRSLPATERRPARLVAGAGLAFTAAFIACNGLLASVGGPTLPEWPTSIALFVFAYLVTIAILRDRLFEVDLMVNRVLVYLGLTAVIVALYGGVVAAAGAAFGSHVVTSGLTAVVVALLALPLRRSLQERVDTLMYGRSADRFEAVSRLGQRMEAGLTPTEMLEAVTAEITTAMAVPYAAIELQSGHDGPVIVAFNGACSTDQHRVPLMFKHERLGDLIVGARAPGEVFRDADVALLSELARQAAVTVRATELSLELQRSREQIVTAREEERRRLRRDLHDGFGPQLAGVALQLDAAENLAQRDPARAGELITRARDETQATVAAIRRLVYGLRPPSLDERGLVDAVREQASRLTNNGLEISVQCDADLTELPAAAEVAAYRIAVEAISNVARHARAARCTVSFRAGETLIVEVSDDGRGMREDESAGVGISSMRERARELGGRCQINRGATGGTHVLAEIPLAR